MEWLHYTYYIILISNVIAAFVFIKYYLLARRDKIELLLKIETYEYYPS
jgi:hypothetical protein